MEERSNNTSSISQHTEGGHGGVAKEKQECRSDTTGVILLNLGGPDSLQAVRPFLFNLFSDRQIIKLGAPFLQKPLAWLISTIRSRKTERMYSLIGGKSPIVDISKAQAMALEEALNKQQKVVGHQSPPSHPPLDRRADQGGVVSFKVYIGMSYWHPFIEDVIPQIHKDGIGKLVGLSLYPQYSVTTSGSSFAKFREITARYDMETRCVESWHNHPLYIEAMVDLIREGLEYFSSSVLHSSSVRDVHVLFSAHSLPQEIIDRGDPYVDHTTETIREITKQLPLTWHLSYQSKSGPVKWLEPSTDAKLEELGKTGVKNILVVPISFVSDHIETLYEIDVLYAQKAQRLGINLRRSPSLNTHPKFIEALRDLVEKSLQDKSAALP
jgi:ferrochelatase